MHGLSVIRNLNEREASKARVVEPPVLMEQEVFDEFIESLKADYEQNKRNSRDLSLAVYDTVRTYF